MNFPFKKNHDLNDVLGEDANRIKNLANFKFGKELVLDVKFLGIKITLAFMVFKVKGS